MTATLKPVKSARSATSRYKQLSDMSHKVSWEHSTELGGIIVKPSHMYHGI